MTQDFYCILQRIWMFVFNFQFAFFFEMKDDVNLFDYNVQDRVNDFVAAAVSQVSWDRLLSTCN